MRHVGRFLPCGQLPRPRRTVLRLLSGPSSGRHAFAFALQCGFHVREARTQGDDFEYFAKRFCKIAVCGLELLD